MILHKAFTGKKLDLLDYMGIRLIGGLMAYLTPSAIGGEPGRAYLLAKKSDSDFTPFFALTIFEVYQDIVFTNIVAIMFSFLHLPYTIPVILLSLFVLTSWTLLVIGWIKGYGEGIIDRFFISRLPKIIKEHYNVFTNTFKQINNRCSVLCLISSMVITIMYQVLSGITIYYISLSIDPSTSLLDAFAAYIYALALGALPTPGGAGAIEYGLTIAVSPGAVVLSRTITLLYVIVSGSIVLLTVYKSYVSELLEWIRNQ